MVIFTNQELYSVLIQHWRVRKMSSNNDIKAETSNFNENLSYDNSKERDAIQEQNVQTKEANTAANPVSESNNCDTKYLAPENTFEKEKICEFVAHTNDNVNYLTTCCSEDSESDSASEISNEDSSDNETNENGKNCEKNISSSNYPIKLLKKLDEFHITPAASPEYDKVLRNNNPPIKSEVTVKRQTDSLKNLLTYDSSSDDSDSEKNSPSDAESDSSSDQSYYSENEISNETTTKKKEGAIWKKTKPTVTDLFEDEYVPPPLDISQLNIDIEKEEFLHVGYVASIIDKIVTIETIKGTPAFDLDTYLFIEKTTKIPLGTIYDVLGPVSSPLYVVRFCNTEDITNMGIKKGMEIFAAHKSEYSKYIFVKQLMCLKGSDASWKGDQEVPPEMAEFSDDDEEQQHTKTKKNLKRKHNNSEQYREYEQIMNQCNVVNTRACHMTDFYHQHAQGRNHRGPIINQHLQVQPQNPQWLPLFNPAVPPPAFVPVGAQGYRMRPEGQVSQNWTYGYNMSPTLPVTTNWNNINYERYRGDGPSSQR